MMRILAGRELNLILRLFLGGMFIYAAWDKVLNPYEFAASIRAYKIVPFALSNFFALSISWTELVAAAMLVLGILTRKAAGAAFLLLAVFTVAITATVVRGMAIDCGCFGEGGASTSWLLIGRNLALLVAAALVIRYNDGFLCLFPGVPRRAPEPERF
jgi:uncharacterized membrane protein YphA (DoxX/SURF4 family)